MTITPEKVRALLDKAERWRDASPAAGDAWTKLRTACPDIARAYLEAVERVAELQSDHYDAWTLTTKTTQISTAGTTTEALMHPNPEAYKPGGYAKAYILKLETQLRFYRFMAVLLAVLTVIDVFVYHRG